MINTDAFYYVVRSKGALLLLELYNSKERVCKADLAKTIDTTLASTYKNLDALNELGLIDYKKSGRSIYVNLTVKGKKVAETFNFLKVTL